MQSEDFKNVNNTTNVIVPQIKLQETCLIPMEQLNQFQEKILREEKLCEKSVRLTKENIYHENDKNDHYEVHNIQLFQKNINLCQEKTFTKWINSHLEKVFVYFYYFLNFHYAKVLLFLERIESRKLIY